MDTLINERTLDNIMLIVVVLSIVLLIKFIFSK